SQRKISPPCRPDASQRGSNQRKPKNAAAQYRTWIHDDTALLQESHRKFIRRNLDNVVLIQTPLNSACGCPHQAITKPTEGSASRGLAILAYPVRRHRADDTINGAISQSNRWSFGRSAAYESVPASPTGEPAYSRRASHSAPPAGR